jgi:hypothetical protein
MAFPQVLGRPHVRWSACSTLLWPQVLDKNDTPPGTTFAWDKASVAKRAYKNKALALLCATGEEHVRSDVLKRFREANNMTDSTAAIGALLDTDCEERTQMLAEFYERWKGDPLVVLKWLTMQVLLCCSLFVSKCSGTQVLGHPHTVWLFLICAPDVPLDSDCTCMAAAAMAVLCSGGSMPVEWQTSRRLQRKWCWRWICRQRATGKATSAMSRRLLSTPPFKSKTPIVATPSFWPLQEAQ